MNILVFSPHPDDDALGCGGTIRKHVLNGDTVHIVYVTSGELGCPGMSKEDTAKLREAEAGVCSQVLQTHRVTFLRFPDGGLAAMKTDLARHIRELLDAAAPDLIYAPHPGDAHTDHAIVGELAMYFGTRIAEVRLYEVWTPLPKVDLCVDITGVVTTKRNAIRAFASQVQRNGFDEAILSLNHYRGVMHFPGGPVMFAECFEVA